MNRFVRNALTRVADILWPRICPVTDCGHISTRPSRHICATCFAALPLLEVGGVCDCCGMPIASKPEHRFVCEVCQSDPPAYTRARSALRYLGTVPQLVQDFKYRNATYLNEDFVDVMEAAAKSKFNATAIDVLLPVPLHPNRLRERGYNQSELLAAGLARRLNRKMDNSSLCRQRDTEHQARSSGAERRTNLRGAFDVPNPAYIRGRTVLLIDDVMTTGSTLSACAKALKKAGAANVWCLTLARAIR